MLKHFTPLLTLVVAGMMSCQSNAAKKENTVKKDSAARIETASDNTKSPEAKIAKGPIDKAAVMARKQVPVVCYHQIRDWKPTDSKGAKDYIVQIAAFKEHMKMLADSGYHTILPDQLYNYLVNGAELPSKPIMLTFDDTDLDQYTIAAPEMKKYGFKGVFFVMTVSIGRPHYMTKEMIKELSDKGHVIGSHTWDHHNFKKFQGKDWEIQLDKPTKKLEEITGKKITWFAYPFGLWNAQGIPELKKRGFIGAFQLAEKRDPNEPMFTIRRILDSGYWSAKTLSNSIRNSF
ncbi:polysaccharide deacetylase family protein [Mucilaginibacter litoreus]|uniref:Polysaccharide deacetylase family protein n=1 Tax=Mucilaginibacter litoreus TaxID=1048221 RepID=A0ABW3AVJ2_9SPHI